MEGWVKLHRSIVDWKWITSPNHVLVFIQVLARANYKETSWRKEVIKPGQLLTGAKQISSWTGLSEMKVRKCLRDLAATKEITIKPTNKFSIITINNWSEYQDLNSQTTNKQLTNDTQTTTSNKDNKYNKENNIFIKPSPLSALFDHMPEVQKWLNEGNHDTHAIALKKFPENLLQSELPNLFQWASRNNNVRAEHWILRRLEQIDVTKPSNKSQKQKTRITPGNPTGNPYLDDNGNVKSEGA